MEIEFPNFIFLYSILDFSVLKRYSIFIDGKLSAKVEHFPDAPTERTVAAAVYLTNMPINENRQIFRAPPQVFLYNGDANFLARRD